MYCQKCGAPIRGEIGYCLVCSTELEPKYRIKYAGFWRRVPAFLIDSIINLLVANLFRIGAIAINEIVNEENMVFIFAFLCVFIIPTIFTYLYFALMESSSKQATLGKMIMRIIVTDINGDRISFGIASMRHLGKILSSLILCIGFIMAGFTKKKQALHDIMAGTLVILKPSVMPEDNKEQNSQ